MYEISGLLMKGRQFNSVEECFALGYAAARRPEAFLNQTEREYYNGRGNSYSG